MKDELSQYLEETYNNTVSRNCIKIILESRTQKEYLNKIKKQIDKEINKIIEIKQSICVMDQFISYLYSNDEARRIDGFTAAFDFYANESNKLCNELNVKIENLHDYIDILAIAKANSDMNGKLIASEREMVKKYGNTTDK